MSKAHRGKGIRELFARGRGVCPVCGTSGIKLLYEQESGDKKIKVCKPCKAAIKHGKKSISAPAAE
jgi:RNA polymerase subunit RPABC4/transcription elongation factor Spt4